MTSVLIFSFAQVGVFAGISVTLRAIGCLFAVHVLQKYAHMSDAAIAAVTLLFGAAANVVEGLATTSTMLYICKTLYYCI